jgi:hypothetical protein
MLLLIEIALLVMGIIALVRGEITLSKRKVVTGAPARLIGLLAMAPLPIAFAIGFVHGVMHGAQAGPNNDPIKFAKDNMLFYAMIEAGILLVVGLLLVTIALACAKDPRDVKRARREEQYEDDDEWEDDRPNDRPNDRSDRRGWDR